MIRKERKTIYLILLSTERKYFENNDECGRSFIYDMKINFILFSR